MRDIFGLTQRKTKKNVWRMFLGGLGVFCLEVDIEDSFFMMKSNVSVKKGFIVKFGGIFD